MIRITLLLVVFISAVTNVFSQTANAFLENFTLNTSGTPTYTFDISAQRTGGTWGLGNNSSFTINFTPGAFVTSAASDATFGTGINVVGGTAGYSLSAAFPGTSSMTITVNYSGNAGSANNLASKTVIARVTLKVQDITKTANLSWGAANILRTNGSTVTTTTSGSNNTALPVELMQFSAIKTAANSVNLSWSTASEQNNKGFYVERSFDGKNWTVINFTPSAIESGNSNTRLSYAFTDNNAYMPGRVKTAYYRLRQQDFNGTEEFVGGVRTIRFAETELAQFSVYPNPATNNLVIKTGNNEILTATVIDITGKTALNTTFDGSTTLDVSGLQKGTYMVYVKNASAQIIASEKLMIVR